MLNEEYATTIARGWNFKISGADYVTRLPVREAFLDNYEVHQVGGQTIPRCSIPADELPDLNANIFGTIELVAVLAPRDPAAPITCTAILVPTIAWPLQAQLRRWAHMPLGRGRRTQ